jgi:hypothetical protein
MKLSTYDHILKASSPELKKSQSKLLGVTRKIVHPLITFWRFSCYYGNFIAYRQ